MAIEHAGYGGPVTKDCCSRAMDEQSAPSAPSAVPRTTLLDELRVRLHSLQQRNAGDSRQILNICGATHTGKTSLARQIFAHFGLHYAVLWLDVAPELAPPEHTTRQPLATVIATLNEQIASLRYVSLSSPEPESDPTAPPPPAETPVHVALAGQQPDPHQPLILLLDHLDDVDYWRWLQAELLLPLLGQPALIICLSQSELYWDFWQLRAQCVVQEMPPFTPAEAQQYMGEAGSLLLRPMQQLAGDALYPGIIDAMYLALQQHAAASHLPVQVELPVATLPAADPMLYYVGWLRQLDVLMMQDMLHAFAPQWQASKPGALLLHKALQRWRAQGYIRPDQATECLIPTLRQQLVAYLRTVDSPLYQAMGAWLARAYAERSTSQQTRLPDRASFFTEWLYHSTAPFVDALPAANRDQWHSELVALLQHKRLRAVGREALAVSLHRDPEVLRRLKSVALFEPVLQAFETLVAPSDQSPPMLAGTRRAQYEQSLLQSWRDNPLLAALNQEFPGGMESLLRALDTPGSTATLATLRLRLNRVHSQELSPRLVSDALATLQSAGLVVYDQHNGSYHLSPPVRSLLHEQRTGTITTIGPSQSVSTVPPEPRRSC